MTKDEAKNLALTLFNELDSKKEVKFINLSRHGNHTCVSVAFDKSVNAKEMFAFYRQKYNCLNEDTRIVEHHDGAQQSNLYWFYDL